MKNPKEIVRLGYDRLGSTYRRHYEAGKPDRYQAWLTDFAALLPPGGRVLELGCADGIPAARYLSRPFAYLWPNSPPSSRPFTAGSGRAAGFWRCSVPRPGRVRKPTGSTPVLPHERFNPCAATGSDGFSAVAAGTTFFRKGRPTGYRTGFPATCFRSPSGRGPSAPSEARR